MPFLPSLHSAPLWSLQVGEQFYLLLPTRCAVGFHVRNLRRFLAGLCREIAPLLRLFLLVFNGSTHCHGMLCPHAVPYGCACLRRACGDPGTVAGQPLAVSRSGAVRCTRHGRRDTGGLCLAPSTCNRGFNLQPCRCWAIHDVALACAFLLTMIVLRPPSPLATLLRWRPLVYTGEIAYGLYLLHAPMSWMARTLIMRIFGINVESHSAIAVPITFFVSFLAASISWRFFESPILALKERFKSPGLCVPLPIYERPVGLSRS